MDKKILIYDTRALPENMTLEEVIEVYHATKVVMYDSHTTGNLPYIIDADNADETEIVFLNRKKIDESNVKFS